MGATITMRKIGTIQQVQIQTGKLKAGEAPNRYYEPKYIEFMDALLLTELGAIGVTDGGVRIVDIHHAAHPETRNNGTNGISIGFTSHYAQMRDQFGAHVVDGIAGENIIIAADQRYHQEDLANGIVIESAGKRGKFSFVKVAAPCNEFSTFCLTQNQHRPAPETLKAALQFLNGGLRGFMIAPMPDVQQFEVRAGDTVYLAI